MTARTRDPLVDMVRGLALLMIFVNHVPGNPLEHLTSRNFGFSDATEVFVFLAGYSAAAAYGPRLASHGLVRTGLRIWGRAFRLYVVHLFTLLLAIALVAAASAWAHDPHFLDWINLGPVFADPAHALPGMVLLSHQAGYFNILPLYVLLLLGTPVLLAVLRWRPAVALTTAATLYVAVQLSGVNLPVYPGNGGWFFNPLAWQMMFVAGAWCGHRAAQGVTPLRRHPALLAAAAALVLTALGMKLANYYPSPDDLPLPFFLYGQEKTFATVPRLLHALALLYLGGHVAARFLRNRHGVVCRSLEVLGRQGLAVFCLGSVLAVAAQTVLFITDAGTALECAIIGAGIILQIGLAWLLTWHSSAPAAAAPAALPSRRWFWRSALR